MLDNLLPAAARKVEVARRQIRLTLHATGSSRVVALVPPVEEFKEIRDLRSALISVEEIASDAKELIQARFRDEFKDFHRKFERYRNSATYLNRLANLCELGGDYSKAQQFLEAAYEIERTPLFATKLASTLVQQNRPADARKLLIEPSQAGDVEANLRLASLDVLERRFDSAEKFVDLALVTEPESYNARLFAGTLCLLKGKFEHAVSHFRIASDENASSAALLVSMAVAQVCLGHTSKAIRSLRTASTINPLSSNVVAFLADLAYAEGKSEEAVPTLERHLAYEQKSATMWARLGRAYHALKQYDLAIKALKAEAALRPSPSVFNNLGAAYWNKGEQRRAREFFEFALSESSQKDGSGRLTALGNMVGLLINEGSFERAVKMSEEVLAKDHKLMIARDPVHCVIYLHNLTALSRLGRYAALIERCESILSWSKITSRLRLGVLSDLIYHFTMIVPDLSNALKRSEEVLQIIGECQDCDERTRTMARNNVAFTYLEAGRIKEAEAVLRSVVSAIHKEAHPTATFGLLHIRKGHVERGEELYREAIGLVSDSLIRRYFAQKMNLEIGRAYLTKGETERARMYLLNAARESAGLPAVKKEVAAEMNRLPKP